MLNLLDKVHYNKPINVKLLFCFLTQCPEYFSESHGKHFPIKVVKKTSRQILHEFFKGFYVTDNNYKKFLAANVV